MVNLTDQVDALEKRMDGMQKEVNAVRGTIQTLRKSIANMLEQFAYWRAKGEEQERASKSKGKEGDRPSEFTQDSEVTPGVGVGQGVMLGVDSGLGGSSR